MTANSAPSAQPAGPMDRPALPDRCEVLVVGSGPAGSACATLLAQAGVDVLLVDQHDFPREKVCGDGLIPDAHQALARLGLLDAVMAQACHVSHVRCVGPRGGQVDVPGRLAVLPRQQLDLLLHRHAAAAGATVRTPVKFEGLIEAPGTSAMPGPSGGSARPRVIGARLRHADATHDVRADWVVLATGAQIQPMVSADLCTRRTPSGIALRAYVRNPAVVASQRTMDVVWHRDLRPGYGWIFPAGDATFNIGVGAFFRPERDGRARAADANLREVFDAFTHVYAPARALMDGGELVGELKGAPLRCTLAGARSSRPGLLATGEAIGSTYDFTGEGIGKALETGILAAEALLRGRRAGADDAAVRADYDAALQRLKPKFTLYERANGVNQHPWLAELVIARARRSPRLLRRMTGVLEETSNPGHLFSLRGIYKLLTE
ncbi:MAG TPA: FAD-dependent monooxygenase [Burkholderiaceae bacterium]|nr:FAD-dependent monooxygenase [Burkholderiaceae bacterium]